MGHIPDLLHNFRVANSHNAQVNITANERSQRAAPTVSTFKNREGVSKATEDVQVALWNVVFVHTKQIYTWVVHFLK